LNRSLDELPEERNFMNKTERSMKTKILGVFVLGFALSSFASDSASAQNSQFNGTWNLDVSLDAFPVPVPVTFTVNRSVRTRSLWVGPRYQGSWEVSNNGSDFVFSLIPIRIDSWGFGFAGTLTAIPSGGYEVNGVWGVGYYEIGSTPSFVIPGKFNGYITP
jgi:hypothetical protein